MKITSNLQPFGALNVNGLKRTNNINNSHMSMPLRGINKDMVSFSGIKKISVANIDKANAKKAALSLVSSTSGHRAIYPTEMFNRDLMKLFAAGVGQWVKNHPLKDKSKQPTVMIGGDTRQATKECMQDMANVLISQGINVQMNQKPVPTPLHALYAKEHKDDVNLSILLTASHNPWAYGGVNLVTKDGAIAGSEVTQDVANEIIDISEKGGYFINTKNKGKKTTIDEDAYQLYKTKIEDSGLIDFDKIKSSGIEINYDSLDGTGGFVLPRLFSEKAIPFNKFSPAGRELEGPNPEAKNLVPLMKRVQASSSKLAIGIANDGDADRFGVVDRDGTFITPNDVILLAAYHLNKHKGKQGAIVKSQTTSTLLDSFAKTHGLETHTTPVGFKYIGEDIIKIREQKKSDILIAGEESGGLTVPNHIPEKDGIIAVMLLTDLMATEQKPLGEILKEIKSEMDVHFEANSFSKKLDDDNKKEEIVNKMETIYNNAVNAGNTTFAQGFEIDVEKTKAHRQEMIHYSGKSDGVKLFFTNGSSVLVRKSGTEPKVRGYVEAYGQNDGEALENMHTLTNILLNEIMQ